MNNNQKVIPKSSVFWMKYNFKIKAFGTIVIFLLLCTFGCDGVFEKRNIRIAVARFFHETCTFCPDQTTIEDWEYYGPPTHGIQTLRIFSNFESMCNEYSNVYKCKIMRFVSILYESICNEYKGIELVGILSPRTARGNAEKGWITKEAFDKYSNIIVNDLRQARPLDGVYLSLHGAMAVNGIPKPEAEFVRRVRKAVGNIPIIVKLDLHANEDHELSDVADAVFIQKRFPHYDNRIQEERAARIMIKTIRGSYKPTMATRKPGIIIPSIFQRTGVSPSMEIMERARIWECRKRDVYVSVAFGYAYADVPDVGVTVMVVTNNDQKLADKIADDMSNYIWSVRKEFAGKKLPKTKEGVTLAIATAETGKTPVIITDHNDLTRCSTHILEELIRQGAKNFCITTLRDEKAIKEIQSRSKVGDKISIDVGGYLDKFAGNPVRINGKVEFLGEYDGEVVAVLVFGENNRVILTPNLKYTGEEISIFASLGIDFESLDIVVLKSYDYMRWEYLETGLVGAIIEIDAPVWYSTDLTTLHYKNIPKDIYPIYRND